MGIPAAVKNNFHFTKLLSSLSKELPTNTSVGTVTLELGIFPSSRFLLWDIISQRSRQHPYSYLR